MPLLPPDSTGLFWSLELLATDGCGMSGDLRVNFSKTHVQKQIDRYWPNILYYTLLCQTVTLAKKYCIFNFPVSSLQVLWLNMKFPVSLHPATTFHLHLFIQRSILSKEISS